MSGDHNAHQADQCNHLWKYIGSKRQAALACAYCQALRTNEPPAREWVGFTDEDYEEFSKLAPLEVILMLERNLRSKNNA